MAPRLETELATESVKSAINSLRSLGLSTYEARAYLALVRNPDSSATKLCNETSIPDSKIYFALEELQRKGLVLVSEGVPRYYRALHPKEALSKLKASITQEYEAQVDNLNHLITNLEPLYARSEREEIELAYVVKGFENVLGRVLDLLKTAKREAILFVPNMPIYERLRQQASDLRRAGVKIKLAVPSKLLKHIDASRFTEVRKLTPDCEECWLAIVDGKTIISSSNWETERCHAILTQDSVLVAMGREYFENPRCCI